MVTHTIGGAREVRTFVEGADAGSPRSWSAGGNLLAYTIGSRGAGSDIRVLVMDGSSSPVSFLDTEFNETFPTISPDGKWIAYVSDESGNNEVYVRSYPDTGTAWQISTGGGGSPLWSRDGSELYFTFENKMLAVPIETRPTFGAGRPEVIIEGGFSTAYPRNFDIAPDGRSVTVRHTGGETGKTELRMLLSWQEAMRRTTSGGR